MARGTLTVQECSLSGITPSYTAASADGDKFTNDGYVMLHVKNGNGAATRTVTVVTPATKGGLAIADAQVTVAISGEKMIGPFRADLFNQTDGTVHVDYDDEADVTIAAVKVKP